LGVLSFAVSGGAIGLSAYATSGGAAGFSTKTSSGFAGGLNAKTIDALGEGIDAIQLGTGTNTNVNTLQVYTNQLLDASGNIPSGRMTANAVLHNAAQTLTAPQQVQARANILASPLRPTQTDIAGTSHTFALANEGQIVVSLSGSATAFTIPLNGTTPFPVGSIIGAEQHGAGVLSIQATAGVTLNGVNGATVPLTKQWGAVAVRKIATDSWVLIGAI
jgi:hypothetical protein